MENSERRRYRFGPRNQRGIIASLRPLQVGTLAVTLFLAVICSRVLPPAHRVITALVVVLIGTLVSLVPIAGRSVIEWLPSLWVFVLAGVTGKHRETFSLTHGRLKSRTPKIFEAFELIELAVSGRQIGAVCDMVDRTLSAVLVVHGDQFALLDEQEWVRRTSDWSSVLAALNRTKSVYRLKWIQRTVPDSGERYRARAARVLSDQLKGSARYEALASYEDAVEGMSAGAMRRDQLIILSTRLPNGFARHASGNRAKVAAAKLQDFAKQVMLLEGRCREAGLHVDGALTRHGLSRMVQRGFDDGKLLPVRTSPWPVALEERWECIRTDNLWHATYWIAEWPRSEVSSGFLLPLLLDSSARRSITMCLSPIGAQRAVRDAEQKRTSSFADVDLRRKYGFAFTSRIRSQHEALIQREEELANGHAGFSFSGYITVSAESHNALQESCEQVEQSCALAHLEVRRLFGIQSEALCFGLLNARGCA